MAGDKSWLVGNLALALGWDPSEAESVAEAIAAARSQAEVDELTQSYLGGGPEVKALVSKFTGASAQKSARHHPVSGSTGRQHRPGERQAGSVTVRHVPGGRLKRNEAGGSSNSAPEKDVCNCLACGKIYFTRNDTADTVLFIEQGGRCTFCGAIVTLTHSGSSETRPPASQRTVQSKEASISGSELHTQSDQAAEARAFKDRLVDYDRNARQRTTVVDDQNDFFEIDTNAWLNPEERAQLKRQEQEMQQAEEARKRRVTVTLDLLGRKVVMADDEPPTAQSLQNAQATLAAARATGSEIPQGGGTATETALKAAARIQPNLSLKIERPMFVPTTPETREARQARRGMPAAQAPAADEHNTRGVIGGWGDERRSSALGSGMSADDARGRSGKLLGPVHLAEIDSDPQARNGQRVPSTGSGAQKARAAELGRTKRPQLKRLQHDDPFEALDIVALDDVRPED